MLTFMDYILQSFSSATNWNPDSSYSSLTATVDGLLDFPIPTTLGLTLSSLASPQYATSYTLHSRGALSGSLAYLYSTVSLPTHPSHTSSIPLRSLVRGYRHLSPPYPPSSSRIVNDNGRKDTLLHATLHLPTPSQLTALYLRRVTPQTLLCVSLNSSQAVPTGPGAPPQAMLLGHVIHDTGKYSAEGLFSTDGALCGVRGLWNFGSDPRKSAVVDAADVSTQAKELHEGLTDLPPTSSSTTTAPSPPPPPSLLSAGAEVYYSPLSSVIGLSTGLRFTTLPTSNTSFSQPSANSSKPLAGTSATLLSPPHTQSTFPYTLALTLTPLTGSLCTSYSVHASKMLSLSSRFGFNVYSWESEMVLGAEIWRRKRQPQGLEWAVTKARSWLTDDEVAAAVAIDDGDGESVVKIRVDEKWNTRVLWEGRVKSLLVSAGVDLGPGSLKGGEGMGIKGVGIEVSYSS